MNGQKMQVNLLLLLSVTFSWLQAQAAPAPQDFQGTALKMANQMKETIENGAAEANAQVKFISAKVNDVMAVGYGEVMKMPAGGRRRREIDSQAVGAGNSMSYESDYSNESDLIYSGESLSEEQRKKRAAAPDSASRSSSSHSSSSSSSSSSSTSSSSESEDR